MENKINFTLHSDKGFVTCILFRASKKYDLYMETKPVHEFFDRMELTFYYK